MKRSMKAMKTIITATYVFLYTVTSQLEIDASQSYTNPHTPTR